MPNRPTPFAMFDAKYGYFSLMDDDNIQAFLDTRPFAEIKAAHDVFLQFRRNRNEGNVRRSHIRYGLGGRTGKPSEWTERDKKRFAKVFSALVKEYKRRKKMYHPLICDVI